MVGAFPRAHAFICGQVGCLPPCLHGQMAVSARVTPLWYTHPPPPSTPMLGNLGIVENLQLKEKLHLAVACPLSRGRWHFCCFSSLFCKLFISLTHFCKIWLLDFVLFICADSLHRKALIPE